MQIAEKLSSTRGEKVRVGIIVQARMKSSRLPGKVMRIVGGKPLLAHHLERLQPSKVPIYVATTFCRCDNQIAELAERMGCPVVRGSKSDVLNRYCQVAQNFSLDTVVRTTGDCPLIDGKLIAQSLQQYQLARDNRLYLSPCLKRTFPRGLDFEIFSSSLLREAHKNGTRAIDREHVTPYLYHPPRPDIHLAHVLSDIDLHKWRLCVDTPEDLELIKILLEEHAAHTLFGDQLLSLLQRVDKLRSINKNIAQTQLQV